MMNKKIILWTAASIITFLAAFLHQRLSPYYPVSGSIGIEGNRVTYLFPGIHYGKDHLKILVRKDLQDLRGKLKWRTDSSTDWNETIMNDSGKYLSVFIKFPDSAKKMTYYGELIYKTETFRIPATRNVDLVFKGKRPSSVLNVLYFFLFGGLLLSTRGALEFFNADNKKTLFPFLSAVFFFIASIIFYPFIKSYELNAINRSVPPFASLFDAALIIIFLLWVTCTILMLRYKNKILMLAAGILTLIIYQFSDFY